GQEGIYRHVCEVAQAAGELPIILYNIPSRTGVSLAPETLARLTKVARIKGLKEASGSLATAMDFQDAAPEVALISGDDALTLPILAIGGTGVISVAANVVPEEMVSLVDAGRRGDFPAARKIHRRLSPLFKALFAETNPIPVKAAMELLGKCSGEVRLPLTPATPETRARLEKVLGEMKVLK
ncbi:MAG: 4-hydroxy-tetrahydrodipicolinate synthase, partial [Planctomycetales bacterium]|nr:4-hydroxy-tetrahydrodipicolinate synthase [Planctomycetales bacterium]